MPNKSESNVTKFLRTSGGSGNSTGASASVKKYPPASRRILKTNNFPKLSANIFILNFLLEVFVNFVNVMNRYIHTAAAGGRLRVEALFDVGAAEEIRFFPEASASFIPTNIICLCNCSVIFDMLEGLMRCRVLCKESSLTKTIFSLLIVCISTLSSGSQSK
jgi:hypothetical protein